MYILQDLCTVKCFTLFSTILREIPVKILKNLKQGGNKFYSLGTVFVPLILCYIS